MREEEGRGGVELDEERGGMELGEGRGGKRGDGFAVSVHMHIVEKQNVRLHNRESCITEIYTMDITYLGTL